ncbi:MAG: ParB/RepB/Spo0J family partition protein [Saprospiraceae bacterium]
MLEMALVENIQRANLNALEIGNFLPDRWMSVHLTHEALSDGVGKDRSTVTNYVRLLKLPAQIQASVKEGQLSMGHARALAGIENLVLQLDIYKDTIQQHLSVRALENLIKTSNTKPQAKNNTSLASNFTPELMKIKDKISHHLGTKVDIKRSFQGKGSITIMFSSDAEFNQITDLLTGD